MRTKSLFHFLSLVLTLTLLLSLSSPAFAMGKPASVDVQILALNDFHGALDPYKGNGGAAYLATYVKNLSAGNPNTVKVSAGDMIGASPIQSALFHDEPTIQVFNLMGFDFSAVGNHEFDEGCPALTVNSTAGVDLHLAYNLASAFSINGNAVTDLKRQGCTACQVKAISQFALHETC